MLHTIHFSSVFNKGIIWANCTVFEPSWSHLWPLRPSYSAKVNSGLFITGASWQHSQVALLNASHSSKRCTRPVMTFIRPLTNWKRILMFWLSVTGTTMGLWLITTPRMLSQPSRMEASCASPMSCHLICVLVEGDSSARPAMLTWVRINRHTQQMFL